jgi:hypothetical protein
METATQIPSTARKGAPRRMPPRIDAAEKAIQTDPEDVTFTVWPGPFLNILLLSLSSHDHFG